jgi:uncharacterized protein (DUF305 family)
MSTMQNEHMILRLSAIALTMVSSALILSACSPTSRNDATTSAASSVSTDFSANDVMFAQMMIPHHQQALDMSRMAETRTTNPEVLAFAKQISDAQLPEIEQMRGWLTRAGASMDMGHEMHMDGMLSDGQMTRLSIATGPEFDRLFLEGMIAHHEGAIAMSSMIADSSNAEAAKLGSDIATSQAAEIAAMQNLLATL